MKKTSVLLTVALLVFLIFVSQIASNIRLTNATPSTLKVPTEYPTIQAAINAADPDDTISVASGEYLEHVVVNKTVKLVGDNKETTIIDGNRTGPVILITAANVGVSGFTIQNATEGGMSSVGVSLEATAGSNITGNIIRNNRMGISLVSSSNNVFKDNMIKNNILYGIYLRQSGQNNFDNNTATDNHYGFVISLYGSGSNILRNNNMSRNSQNFKLSTAGARASHFIQDIDPSNTVDGKPIYYWMNQHDRQVPTNAGYVAIINSTNIIVKDLVLTRNGEGVLFVYTTNSTIDNVNASNNIGGNGIVLEYSNSNHIFRSTTSNNLGKAIWLYASDDNIILGNKMTNNSGGIMLDECTSNLLYGNSITNSTAFGIYTINSKNNTMYRNTFVNNTMQISSETSSDSWDAGYPSGGNYWSDYEDRYPDAEEIDGSGLWDTPYFIDENNTDRYPLVDPPLPLPAFVVSASPFSQNVKPGQSVTYSVTVVSVNSFSSVVHLNGTLSPSSNDISFTFNPETVIPPLNGSVQSTLTVSAVSTAVPETYVVTVNATNAGLYATDTVEIIVLDIIKPNAEAGPDQTVNEDTVVTFDGSGSYDNVGVVNYTWTFVDGDLKTLTGVTATYVFNTLGSYVVTLNVTDAAGNWATDDVAIMVLDVTGPVANAGQDQTVSQGTSVTLDGSNSTDNVGVVSYEWNFGDGTSGTGVSVTHIYANAGTYNVTLTVKDAAGNSATDSITITVTAAPIDSFLLLILAATGGIVAVGVVLGALFLRRRKRKSAEPVR